MYPVYVYDDGVELPKDGEFYVVAGNGTWFHKDGVVFQGYVPVQSIAFLKDLGIGEEPVRCLLPKIPHDIVMKTKKFFVQVFKKYHSEACVILDYNKEDKIFKVSVPRQWNSHAAVNYIRPATSHAGNWLQVGTIHSHCDFNAFHSGTDQFDESSFDGIHVTFGDITHPTGMSISASYVLNNMRCKINPLDCLEGVARNEDKSYRIKGPKQEPDYAAWMEEIDFWMAQVNQGQPPKQWTEAGIIQWKEENEHQEN